MADSSDTFRSGVLQMARQASLACHGNPYHCKRCSFLAKRHTLAILGRARGGRVSGGGDVVLREPGTTLAQRQEDYTSPLASNMADPSLAPRHTSGDHGPYHYRVSDPFATPTLNPADLPTPPQPAARVPSSRPQSYIAQQEISSRPSTLHGGLNNDRPIYPHKSESMSSNGTTSTMSPISSIYQEKLSHQKEYNNRHSRDRQSRDRQSKERRSRDPEKAVQLPYRNSHDLRVAYIPDDEDNLDERDLQERKAVKILLFLSGPVVILSFLNCIWTFISLTITSLTQPVRLCSRRPTFGQQLGGLLGPSLNLQLKSIYTPLPPHADEDLSYRPGMLVAVQLLSPFHSLGIMIAAWIVWIYWISSAVVGDPVGTDKRDDGRETALMLRDWWEKWLVKSMKEEVDY